MQTLLVDSDIEPGFYMAEHVTAAVSRAESSLSFAALGWSLRRVSHEFSQSKLIILARLSANIYNLFESSRESRLQKRSDETTNIL